MKTAKDAFVRMGMVVVLLVWGAGSGKVLYAQEVIELQAGREGVPYAVSLEMELERHRIPRHPGAIRPLVWEVESGTPPPGLVLSSAGLLTGTPILAQEGAYKFTVKMTDSWESGPVTDTRTFFVLIEPPPLLVVGNPSQGKARPATPAEVKVAAASRAAEAQPAGEVGQRMRSSGAGSSAATVGTRSSLANSDPEQGSGGNPIKVAAARTARSEKKRLATGAVAVPSGNGPGPVSGSSNGSRRLAGATSTNSSPAALAASTPRCSKEVDPTIDQPVVEGKRIMEGTAVKAKKVVLKVLKVSDDKGRVLHSRTADVNQSTWLFTATLGRPLRQGEKILVEALDADGTCVGQSAKADVVASEYNWGRVRAYFSAGAVLSKERKEFSQQDIYLQFNLEKNWAWNQLGKELGLESTWKRTGPESAKGKEKERVGAPLQHVL